MARRVRARRRPPRADATLASRIAPGTRVHEKSPVRGSLSSGVSSTREDASHPLASLVSGGLALLGRLLRCLLSLLCHSTCPPLRQGPFVLLRIDQGLEVRESRRVLRAVCPLARRTGHRRSRRVWLRVRFLRGPARCLTGALARYTRAPGSCGPPLPLLSGLLSGLLRSFLRHVSSWFCDAQRFDFPSHPNRWAERSTCTQDVDYG